MSQTYKKNEIKTFCFAVVVVEISNATRYMFYIVEAAMIVICTCVCTTLL